MHSKSTSFPCQYRQKAGFHACTPARAGFSGKTCNTPANEAVADLRGGDGGDRPPKGWQKKIKKREKRKREKEKREKKEK